MQVADVLDAPLKPKRIVQVHRPAARHKEDVPNPLVRQRFPDVVGNPHFPQNSRMVLIIYSIFASPIPGYKPIQNVAFMIVSVLSSVPATR